MLDKNYEKRISKLRKKISEMSALTEQQVVNVFKAIENNSKELIEQVIIDDNVIDNYDIKIDKTCQKIFALNQPVAGDLRFILSAFLINTRVEQIGDLAVNIAISFSELNYTKPIFFNRLLFNEIFSRTQTILADSLKSLIDNNSEFAQKTINNKTILSDLHKRNTDLIIEITKENSSYIDQAFRLFEISNYCKQICENSVSIAEDVFFVVEAQMIRHNYEQLIFSDINGDDDE